MTTSNDSVDHVDMMLTAMQNAEILVRFSQEQIGKPVDCVLGLMAAATVLSIGMGMPKRTLMQGIEALHDDFMSRSKETLQ